MSGSAPTAALLIIGNEILSGRTQDTNLNYLAKYLGNLGILFKEARVVPDVEQAIIEGVNGLRKQYDYVFTSGGIGPTHDDITTACVAKAVGRKVIRHKEAEALLKKHYKPEDLNEARLKMAETPEGAELIDNPVSAAPGYRIENVYVLAGVPRIQQAMLDSLRGKLKGGAPTLSRSISSNVTEGMIATDLGAIQSSFADVDIGSYPFIRDGKLGVSLVARGTNEASLEKTMQAIKALLAKHNAIILED